MADGDEVRIEAIGDGRFTVTPSVRAEAEAATLAALARMIDMTPVDLGYHALEVNFGPPEGDAAEPPAARTELGSPRYAPVDDPTPGQEGRAIDAEPDQSAGFRFAGATIAFTVGDTAQHRQAAGGLEGYTARAAAQDTVLPRTRREHDTAAIAERAAEIAGDEGDIEEAVRRAVFEADSDRVQRPSQIAQPFFLELDVAIPGGGTQGVVQTGAFKGMTHVRATVVARGRRGAFPDLGAPPAAVGFRVTQRDFENALDRDAARDEDVVPVPLGFVERTAVYLRNTILGEPTSELDPDAGSTQVDAAVDAYVLRALDDLTWGPFDVTPVRSGGALDPSTTPVHRGGTAEVIVVFPSAGVQARRLDPESGEDVVVRGAHVFTTAPASGRGGRGVVFQLLFRPNQAAPILGVWAHVDATVTTRFDSPGRPVALITGGPTRNDRPVGEDVVSIAVAFHPDDRIKGFARPDPLAPDHVVNAGFVPGAGVWSDVEPAEGATLILHALVRSPPYPSSDPSWAPVTTPIMGTIVSTRVARAMVRSAVDGDAPWAGGAPGSPADEGPFSDTPSTPLTERDGRGVSVVVVVPLERPRGALRRGGALDGLRKTDAWVFVGNTSTGVRRGRHPITVLFQMSTADIARDLANAEVAPVPNALPERAEAEGAVFVDADDGAESPAPDADDGAEPPVPDADGDVFWDAVDRVRDDAREADLDVYTVWVEEQAESDNVPIADALAQRTMWRDLEGEAFVHTESALLFVSPTLPVPEDAAREGAVFVPPAFKEPTPTGVCFFEARDPYSVAVDFGREGALRAVAAAGSAEIPEDFEVFVHGNGRMYVMSPPMLPFPEPAPTLLVSIAFKPPERIQITDKMGDQGFVLLPAEVSVAMTVGQASAVVDRFWTSPTSTPGTLARDVGDDTPARFIFAYSLTAALTGEQRSGVADGRRVTVAPEGSFSITCNSVGADMIRRYSSGVFLQGFDLGLYVDIEPGVITRTSVLRPPGALRPDTVAEDEFAAAADRVAKDVERLRAVLAGAGSIDPRAGGARGTCGDALPSDAEVDAAPVEPEWRPASARVYIAVSK